MPLDPRVAALARRRTADARVTYWLKVVTLVILSWLVVERIAEYLTRVGFLAAVAVGGLFVAYIFYPIVRRLNERLPLWAAIAIVYLSVGGLLFLSALYIVPILAADLQNLIVALPRLESNAQVFLNSPHVPVLGRLPLPIRHGVQALPAQIGNYLQHDAMLWVGNVLTMLLSVLALAAVFIAIPVVSIYMLTEAEKIKRFLLGMLPAGRREGTKSILAQLDEVVGGFVRGQILIALTVGVMVSGMLLWARVPYALLIGAWAGLVDIVPYLGAVAGAIPGVSLALLTNGVGDAALVTLGFCVINQLEGNLLAPRIVSRTVHLSPLVVIFALLAGGQLFGVIGMLIAVPLAGAARVFIENVRPPEELTNAEVEPGLTKAAQTDVDPSGTTTAATTEAPVEIEKAD